MIEGSVVPASGGGTARAVIGALLEQRTGQCIASSRSWRLETALKPILRDLALESLDDLIVALVTATNNVLADRVVDALLNQETSFFRDAKMFDELAQAVSAMHRAAPDRRLRLWSAGCATGQEPLTLAILLDEQGLPPDRFEIIATDASPVALQRARDGRYSQFEIQRGLSMHRMMRWFEGGGSDWTAAPSLLRQIRYHQHNLVRDAPPAGGYDVILCRNVMLYLSIARRQAVFCRLARALRPGGLLMLGASETVMGNTDVFVPHESLRGLYRLA